MPLRVWAEETNGAIHVSVGGLCRVYKLTHAKFVGFFREIVEPWKAKEKIKMNLMTKTNYTCTCSSNTGYYLLVIQVVLQVVLACVRQICLFRVIVSSGRNTNVTSKRDFHEAKEMTPYPSTR